MIEVWDTNAYAYTPEKVTEFFKLRYQIVCKELGWVAETNNRQEQDEFDAAGLGPIYLLAIDQYGGVTGGFRLLPTTGPHMLKNTFPHLYGVHEIIEDSIIWEASRFIIKKTQTESLRNHTNRFTTALLLQAMCEYGLAHGISDYLVVVTSSMNHLVRRLGALTTVIGTPMETPGETIQATKCEVSGRVLNRIRKVTQVDQAITHRQGSVLEPDYAA